MGTNTIHKYQCLFTGCPEKFDKIETVQDHCSFCPFHLLRDQGIHGSFLDLVSRSQSMDEGETTRPLAQSSGQYDSDIAIAESTTKVRAKLRPRWSHPISKPCRDGTSASTLWNAHSHRKRSVLNWLKRNKEKIRQRRMEPKSWSSGDCERFQEQSLQSGCLEPIITGVEEEDARNPSPIFSSPLESTTSDNQERVGTDDRNLEPPPPYAVDAIPMETEEGSCPTGLHDGRGILSGLTRQNLLGSSTLAKCEDRESLTASSLPRDRYTGFAFESQLLFTTGLNDAVGCYAPSFGDCDGYPYTSPDYFIAPTKQSDDIQNSRVEYQWPRKEDRGLKLKPTIRIVDGRFIYPGSGLQGKTVPEIVADVLDDSKLRSGLSNNSSNHAYGAGTQEQRKKRKKL